MLSNSGFSTFRGNDGLYSAFLHNRVSWQALIDRHHACNLSAPALGANWMHSVNVYLYSRSKHAGDKPPRYGSGQARDNSPVLLNPPITLTLS